MSFRTADDGLLGGLVGDDPRVVNQKFVEKKPQILRLRLPQKAANSAQDDSIIMM
jgi:hypothetical protein